MSPFSFSDAADAVLFYLLIVLLRMMPFPLSHQSVSVHAEQAKRIKKTLFDIGT